MITWAGRDQQQHWDEDDDADACGAPKFESEWVLVWITGSGTEGVGGRRRREYDSE